MKTATLPLDAAWERLEKLLAPEDYLYVLRELYHIVLYTERQRETRLQLCNRIREFENACALPITLSRFPLPLLLKKLELAQYFYPIKKREINFDYFLQPK
ncbi:MAG: hypothetical protein GY821_13275 [Gammaproteobacteria bacterium]|nr:hypothetical protein [Gammaproteobacteria bacterium]